MEESQSAVSNVASLMRNPRARLVIFVSIGVVLLILIVVFLRMKSTNRTEAVIEGAAVQAPGQVPTDPARMNVTPHYAGLVIDNDRQKATEAEENGGSTIPTVITSVAKQDPLPPPPPPKPTKILANSNPNPPTPYTPAYPPPAPRIDPNATTRREAVSAQLSGMLKEWSTPSQMKVVMSEVPSATHASGVAGGAGGAGVAGPAARPMIQAGTLYFGIVDRQVNSDEPGPVSASIVSGPLKGAKLLGEFRRNDGSMVIAFRTMSLPDGSKSIGVNAFAVSQQTDGYGVQTAVDNHYLERYGLLLGAALLRGVAEGYARSGATVVTTVGGSTTTYDQLNNKQIVAQGLGEVGRTVAGVMASDFTRPPTVTVASGTPVGILFVADVMSTDAAGTRNGPVYTADFGANQMQSQAPKLPTPPGYNPPSTALTLTSGAVPNTALTLSTGSNTPASPVIPSPANIQLPGTPFDPSPR
jgi:hypothetical protein